MYKKKSFVALAFSFAAATQANAAIECIEVEAFTVNKEEIASKEDARAASIPEPRLERIQTLVIEQINTKTKKIKAVNSSTDQCPTVETTAVLSGKVTDFKKGNKALRYLVGFGAGAQKVEIMTYLKMKNGTVVAEKDISDRKSGGFLGGSDDKGLKDFAEKVLAFVKKSLEAKP